MQNIQSDYRAKILKYKSLERKYKHIKPTENIKIYEHQFFHKDRHFSHAEAKGKQTSSSSEETSSSDEEETSSSDEEETSSSDEEEKQEPLAYKIKKIVPPDNKDREKMYEAIDDFLKAAKGLPAQMEAFNDLALQIYEGKEIEKDTATKCDGMLYFGDVRHLNRNAFSEYVTTPEAKETLKENIDKIDKIEQTWMEWVISMGYSVGQAIASFMGNIYSLLKKCTKTWKCLTLSIIATTVIVRVLYAFYHGTPIDEEVINLFNLLRMYCGLALRGLENAYESYLNIITGGNTEFLIPRKNLFFYAHRRAKEAIDMKFAEKIAEQGVVRGREYGATCTALAAGGAAQVTATTSPTGPWAFLFGAVSAAITAFGCYTGGGMLGASQAAGWLAPEYALELQLNDERWFGWERWTVHAVVVYVTWSITQRVFYKLLGKASADRYLNTLSKNFNIVTNLLREATQTRITVLRNALAFAKKFNNNMSDSTMSEDMNDLDPENRKQKRQEQEQKRQEQTRLINEELRTLIKKEIKSEQSAKAKNLVHMENIPRMNDIATLALFKKTLENNKQLPKGKKQMEEYLKERKTDGMDLFEGATADAVVETKGETNWETKGETNWETKGETNGETNGETDAVGAATGPNGPMFKQFITEHFLPTAHNF